MGLDLPQYLNSTNHTQNSSQTIHPKSNVDNFITLCLWPNDTGNAYKKYFLLKNDFLKYYWAVFLQNLGS
jgi:hypothetical protein